MRSFSWKSDGLVIGVALLAPTLMTWLYFYVLSGQGILTRMLYGSSKVVLGLLPIAWYFYRRHRAMRANTYEVNGLPKPRRQLSWKLGLDFGLLTLTAMLLLYFLWLKHLPIMSETVLLVQKKLDDAGVDSATTFLFLAIFLTIVHSAYEEYYWRWFIFGHLRFTMPWLKAALISSVGFMLHHILVLYAYLPGELGLLLVIAFSLSIGFGGFVWCCIYQYTGSLLGAWIAHLCADLGIMICGYDLCKSSLGM